MEGESKPTEIQPLGMSVALGHRSENVWKTLCFSERRWKICCVFLKDVWKDVRKTSYFTERRCHSVESENNYSFYKEYNVFQKNTMSFARVSKRLSEKHSIFSNVFRKGPAFAYMIVDMLLSLLAFQAESGQEGAFKRACSDGRLFWQCCGRCRAGGHAGRVCRRFLA